MGEPAFNMTFRHRQYIYMYSVRRLNEAYPVVIWSWTLSNCQRPINEQSLKRK